jgi:hypothetical protein
MTGSKSAAKFDVNVSGYIIISGKEIGQTFTETNKDG